MCDTMVALNNVTSDGTVVLAKNSDRPPNEAQYPLYLPRMRHEEAMVRCTHIEIPQVRETWAVLLSRPFWMWGCEMGVNEFGVAIGNEAVFTKEPLAAAGLLGMDLIRLALERAQTARAALDVITDLLARYGQGGSCDIYHPGFNYHNSFLIADPGAAWVLETAGRYWAARQVTDSYSISNGLTLGSDLDLASPGLVEHAVTKGWCRSEADFDFGRCYSDWFYTRIATACRPRQARTTALLRADRGRISPAGMFAYLRDHGQAAGEAGWAPAQSRATVCMHAADNRLRRSQSTASLVAHLRPDGPTCWMTSASAPCTGIFKPLYIAPLPGQIGCPEGRADGQTLWWAHERLHRAALLDYAARLPLYQDERDGMEAAFVAEEKTFHERYGSAPVAEHDAAQAAFSRLCFDRARVAETEWTARVKAAPVRRPPNLFYRQYWHKQNQTAGLEI